MKRGRRVLRGLLRIPLFYKVLLANVAIAAMAVGITAWLARAYLEGGPEPGAPILWLSFGAGILIITLAANALLLRLALSPLRDLEETVRRVATGTESARARVSSVADRDLGRIIRSFNSMLDRVTRYRERLRELSARSLKAQEEERMRIARELHDDTAQRMVAIALQLSIARKRAVDQPLADQLDRAHRELVEAADGLRRIARGLRPPALDELGLVLAVDAYAREMRERSGLRIDVERSGDDPALSLDAELAAYRIVQEALSNAWRHAAPRRVRIAFEVHSDRVEITVEDDGRGFSREETLERRGETLGLFGMEERASYVGGRMILESEPGVGTRVRLLLPRSRGAGSSHAAGTGNEGAAAGGTRSGGATPQYHYR